MCKCEHHFLIKVCYLYASSAIKKSAYILKKPIKKKLGLKMIFFP